MNFLAFNTLISSTARPKYQLAIAVLPVGLMLGSILPLMIFSSWLQGRFGIPADSAVRDHPDGSAWIAIMLVAMIVLMLLGYALGWVANAAISRVVFGWSPEKIRAVYLRSELPVHWMKGEETASSSADARAMSEWESQRQVGALRFIATRGVLAYGGWMLLAMHIAPTLVKGQGFSMADTLPKIAIWACAGAMFGALVWYGSESSYRKLKQRREPS